MKKVGVVIRRINKGGGVEMALKNLIINLDRIANSQDIKIHVFTDSDYQFMANLDNINKVVIPLKNVLLWDYFILPWNLAKADLDSVVYSKNVIPFTNFILGIKKINLIHDLGYFENELNAYKKMDTWYMRLNIGLSCRRSDKIMSISKFTKNDIISRFQVNENKISVLSLAAEKKFQEINDREILDKTRKKYKLRLPFIFYSGSISPRKNVQRMLQAFKEIKDKVEHNFYFTGARGWNNDEVWEYIKQNNLEDRVRKIGYVEEDELPVLYNLATLCLYTSLYEGFGLPILEAQACGCPVITSNVSSLPEVAGEGAIIVNPYHVEEIKEGLLKIIEDNVFKENLVRKGYENSKKYDWQKTAEKFVKIIKEI